MCFPEKRNDIIGYRTPAGQPYALKSTEWIALLGCFGSRISEFRGGARIVMPLTR